MKILLLNGPNLNLLGKREPEIYGSTTLDDITKQLTVKASESGVELSCFQSNSESELITRLHGYFNDRQTFDALIINPAAFTHTSIAIRDAIAATGVPFIEVHLSNVYAREEFRHQSYFSDLALGVITGLGYQGYEFALHALVAQTKNK